MMLLVFTGIAVVYVKHQSRMMFMELQAIEADIDQLQVEWGMLQLEQATWAEASRVESQARELLLLQEKQAEDVLVIVK